MLIPNLVKKVFFRERQKKLYLVVTICVLSLLTTAIGFIQAKTPPQVVVSNLPQSGDHGLELPDFVLPYSNEETVYWTGGPHAYGTLNPTAKFPSGEGSGLDFASGNSFDVLAMATGTVEDASCNNPGFGCQVAIRHFTGNSVMIYAHLKENSITVKKGDRVIRGDIIAKAGSTGTDNIHLHIELRDGNEVCLLRCLPEDLGGNPIGWDDLLELVDGYQIGGYLADPEGLETYNYDGSAVKGDVEVIYDFRYHDQPGNILHTNVIARVHPSFYCDQGETDCEDNSNPLTQFAGNGQFLSGGNLYLQGSHFLSGNGAGYLVSSNIPSWPDPPGTPNDGATFIADITLPDGTVVISGESLVKTWRLRNSGTSTWDNYQLAFVNGEQMGAPNTVVVPHTTPGQTADISVNLTAPGGNGEYTGYWRLRNPQGTFFGPTIWVKINVGTASNYISVLTTDPPPPADTNQVTIHARTDNFPNFRAMRLKIDGNVVYELGAPEFFYDWQTGNYAPGEHSVLVEVADWTDLSWAHPETRGMTYVLTGNGTPTNHAPYPPNPTSPADWQVYYSGNTAQLCAQDTGDPDGDPISQYQFDIHDSAQLWNSGWVSSNCVTTGALGPYSYQWRVKVRDGQGAESGWSESWHFTLVNPNLTITEFYFEPQDPNSESVKIRACTSGQGGVGITMRVSVNDANDGSGNGEWHILKELGVPCFNAQDAPIWNTLEYGDGQHLVRVEAHGSSTGWDGAAVQEATYSLPYRRPPGNHLVAPIPVSGNLHEPIYLNTRVITFRWQPVLRATDLILHVGTNPVPKDDPNPVYRQTLDPSVTEHQVTFNQDYPSLYWQIEAVNSAGTNASGDQNFGIDRTLPSCSIGTLPDTTFENVFQVSWSTSDALSGVNIANIQYRDSREGEWRNWLTEIPAAKTYDLFYGQAGHVYQFRCRATDNANNSSSYSQPSNQIQVDPTSRPSEPWWDVAYAYKRGILVLNNMPGSNLPVGYPVHIRFDDTTTPSAADIYNASATPVKCNDLRVVYDHSIELDRHMASCQINEIDIWFKSQTAISPGTIDDTSYRLYYGNAQAGNPPADQTSIWYPLLDANTVGLWYFSEGSGTNTSDYSGNGNHGTTGILSWTDGKFGKALASPYPGPGPNGVFVPGNATLGSSIFTLEFFAKRYDMGSEGYIAGMGMSGNGRERMRLLIDSPGKIKFQIDPEPGGASDVWANSGCLPDLEWHHVAVTFDGDRSGNIYCDGVLAGSGLFNESGISNLNFDLHLGSDFSTGTRFNGVIDQVRLSNIVRTSFPYAELALITNEPTVAIGDSITPPTSSQPDLAVLNLRTYPNSTGGVLVEAVIKNQGDVPTENGFFTDLYINHVPSGSGDLTDSIQFWVNTSIGAGTTVTLTNIVGDLFPLYQGGSQVLSPASESGGTLYAQTDSTGTVSEDDNDNNIYNEGVEICVASPDAYEGPDDTFPTAPLIEFNDSQQHNFDRLGDEDWVRIEAQEGITYTIYTYFLGFAADTYLYLYDSDGTTLLASNDDHGGSLASRIEWTAPATGTYYLLVKHWNPNVAGCGTRYTLSFGDGFHYLHLPVIMES